MREDQNNNFRHHIEPWEMKRIHAANRVSIGQITYFNESLLAFTMQGLGRPLQPKTKKSKREIGSSWFKFSQESEMSDIDKLNNSIRELLSILEEKDYISYGRPNTIPQNNFEQPPFIMEEFFAQQYVFVGNETLKTYGYDYINVWIGKPNPDEFTHELYSWGGSYLILVEMSLIEGKFSTTISGCSALRMLYNLVHDNPLFKRDGKEILGRWDAKPIEDKMSEIGAKFIGVKKIKSLYRIRYMTNEQYDPRAPNEGRVHDIFAYPVFVSDIF